jgi:hypothetical protein
LESQVTDVPESPPLDAALAPAAAGGLPSASSPPNHGGCGQSEYNELLYAHLLDADGTRLTYTHFTAKVAWNSMIDITFNRWVQENNVSMAARDKLV